MALNIVNQIDNRVRIRRLLASAFDKTGLERLVPALLAVNPELKIYSTGGTYAFLAQLLGSLATGSLVQVSQYTGQPEMQGGLVKTLDFKLYLGLLSETYNPAHGEDLARAGAVAFDMVVVNLYPFARTVQEAEATPEAARTHIDIGGPCLIRAAAKNFLRVAAVTDPADYDGLAGELQGSGGWLGLETRLRLARKAFTLTAAYDRAIAKYLAGRSYAQVAGCYTLNEAEETGA